jgi:hypothetical protein
VSDLTVFQNSIVFHELFVITSVVNGDIVGSPTECVVVVTPGNFIVLNLLPEVELENSVIPEPIAYTSVILFLLLFVIRACVLRIVPYPVTSSTCKLSNASVFVIES